MSLSTERLQELLVEGGVVTAEEFREKEKEAKRSNIPVTRLLIAEGRLTQQYYSELISKFFNIPIADFKSVPPKPDVVSLLPETIARGRQILVFGKDEKRKSFKVAMTDPTDIENLNFLKEYLKGEVEPYIILPEDLRYGFQLYKKKSSENFELALSGKIRELSTNLKKAEQNALESVPLGELFDTLLDYGAILDASDVYFQPEENELKVRFRVDGLLRDIISLDKSLGDGIAARVKTLSKLRIDEHVKPQDGRFRFRSQDMDLDVRSAIMPTLFGEKITLRLLTSNQAYISFEELGMNKETNQNMEKAVKKPFGMILSSGPTGSGKTTTIYGILSLLNKPEVHITTIEDPIEYIVPNVSQTQVNLQAGITFPSGLRALLRHNPDIIFIGEIRDPETSDISINAALTGHLLISTIHTNDASSTIFRLIDLGVEPFLIGATLNAVLAQRLVRKICANCIESHPPDPAPQARMEAELMKMNIKAKVPRIVFSGKGCGVCNLSGYKGRTGIFELLVVDEGLRTVITSGNLTIDRVKKAACEGGMIPMLEDGLGKIERGVTTLEEVLRVISD